LAAARSEIDETKLSVQLHVVKSRSPPVARGYAVVPLPSLGVRMFIWLRR
jgi:hypothetical protein